MSDTPAPKFRQGAEAVDEAIDLARKAQSGFGNNNWFKWEEGETKILRFLDDKSTIYVAKVHNQVPNYKGKKQPLFCMADIYGLPCEVCAMWERTKDLEKNQQIGKIQRVGIGVAVLRTEGFGDDNKPNGYVDVTELIDEDKGNVPGNLHPIVGIVQRAFSNFWDDLFQLAEKFPVRDRDYSITAKGEGLNRKYQSVPEPLQVDIPNMDERYAAFRPDLMDYIAHGASQENYDRVLRGVGVPGMEDAGSNGYDADPGAAVAASAEAPTIPDDDTELDRLQREKAEMAKGAQSGTYTP